MPVLTPLCCVVCSDVTGVLFVPHQDAWALGYLRTAEGGRELFGVCSLLLALACCLPPGCAYLLTLLGVSLLLSSVEDGAPPEV